MDLTRATTFAHPVASSAVGPASASVATELPAGFDLVGVRDFSVLPTGASQTAPMTEVSRAIGPSGAVQVAVQFAIPAGITGAAGSVTLLIAPES